MSKTFLFCRHGLDFHATRTALPYVPRLLFFVCAAGIAQPVRAQTTLYSDFGAGNSYTTNAAYIQAGPSGGSSTFAFEFTPTVTGTVNSMSAALSNSFGLAATAEILNNAGGLPGSTVLFTSSVIVGLQGVYTFNSPNGSNLYNLTAGIQYWATIIPPTNSADFWYLNNMGINSNVASSNNYGASFTSGTSGTTPAFSLSGIPLTGSGLGPAATPEPCSIALLALAGAPALSMIALRRRKAA